MSVVIFVVLLGMVAMHSAQPQEVGPNWQAPDRGAKVAALIPGSRLPRPTPEELFAEWTAAQVQRWQQDHPAVPAEVAYEQFAATAPTDDDLRADFPRHISPFGRVRSGDPGRDKAEAVLISYCPFCGSHAFSLVYDRANRYHATTTCCQTELYGRDDLAPADYALKTNATASFLHLDDTRVQVPCTIYRDRAGVEWELFIPTLFAHRRWVELCDLVGEYGKRFTETADPVYAHKLALLLDLSADTYYGLPLSFNNTLATGRDGKELTRAEWEAVPRPAIFEVSYLGPWNRRLPLGSKGWLNMFREHIWVEPFVRVRHHPAFRYYSQRTYGDPDALDRKVREKLMRELALMFKSVFSQKLLTNYQEANYVDLWLLGLVLEDEVLIDFAGPAQEVTLYNHTYYDGLNGEGAPNYMSMPGSYFYPFLRDPKGWLQYYPRFLEDHPFYWAADGEMRRLTTVRGQAVEFGDQHQHAWPAGYLTDPAAVARNEAVGSRNWAGYGVGILRVGGPGHRMEACLSYSRASLHNAQDALGLECWVDGVPVLRRGGYAAWWHNARLQWERPEFAALRAMDYPHPIVECERSFDGWSWLYAHSPLCQNNALVDGAGTGRGWGDNRGYGEVITFKGGEAAGAPGSGLQVLDVRDHYSWSRVDREVSDYRRALMGIEGPDGRPYLVGIVTLAGGSRHALVSSAWAERAEANLPEVASAPEGLGQVLLPPAPDRHVLPDKVLAQVRNLQVLREPDRAWDLTWAADMAAYAPRDVRGGPFQRPLPDEVGRVRLRLLGLPQPEGQTQLIRGTGPWIGWLRQPLPGGQQVNGNVAFVDARDFLIEARAALDDAPLRSRFVHVLEGFRAGESSAITGVTALQPTVLSGPERDIVALELSFADGHRDTVIYQSAEGAITVPGDVRTDARYAVLRRRADGEVIAAEACRGTELSCADFHATMPGDFGGTIVDVVGDLTGTRHESALVIRPDGPWPEGESLADRQLLVRVESPLRDPCNEGYRIRSVSAMPGGLLRVEVQDYAPFATSWHEVTELPADRPNVIRTWRPMVDYGNSPWYQGMTLWFPECDRGYTIKRVNEVGGGVGGDTVELMGDVNLAADGIQPGDWYVIYGIRPGLRVTVANDLCWRREPAADWRQYTLRATGAVQVRTAATMGPVWHRCGEGAWQQARDGKQDFAADEAGSVVRLISDPPPWLRLDDVEPPTLVALTLDGQQLDCRPEVDLGWIDPPHLLIAQFRDAHNPLDPESLAVSLNGAALGGDQVQVTASEEGRALQVTVDLQSALQRAGAQPRRHALHLSVADRSVERLATTLRLSFMNRVPLEEDAIYLSDLQPLRAFAHGGLMRDRDYVGNPAQIAGRVYPKCLTLCPETAAEGGWAEVVYELPADRGELVLLADVGVSESAGGRGSVTFVVESGDAPDGPWRALYTSPVMRGGGEPQSIVVPLGPARYLRLRTTDAGDDINSDHAVWGGARLKAAGR